MSARNRLLVIDYEPRSLKRTLALLEATGCSVRSASNAKEIDAALGEEPPDAAIIEPMIPGQDGFRLIQQVKRLRADNPVYVIAASRIYRGPRFRGMAKEAGADVFLERPAHDDQIIGALEKALGGFILAEDDESADTQVSIEIDASQESGVAAPPAAVPLTRERAAASIPRPAIPRPPQAPQPVAPVASASPVAVTAGTVGSTSPRGAGSPVLLSSPVPMIQADPSEIDAALDRLLGPFGDSPAARTVEPEAPELSLDAEFRSRRPPPRAVSGPKVEFDFDDEIAGDAPRPVVIPTRAEVPQPVPVVEPIPAENLGYDLVTGDSGSISAAPPAEDSSDPRYVDFLLQEDPGTGPPPVDPDAKPRTGPIPMAISGEQPLLPNPDDEDIDRILARVFSPGVDASGGVAGVDPPSGAAVPDGTDPLAAEEPQPSPPVPAGLRGMDAGTADLLSSLQELENSLPDGGPPSEFRPDNTWTSTTGFGEATGQALQEIDTSVPFVPPPPPEDERTLQEVLSGISLEAQPTAEEITPPLSSPKVEFDAFRQTGAGLGAHGRPASGSGTTPAASYRSRRRDEALPATVPSRSFARGALVALLLLVLAVGSWYVFLRESGGAGSVAAPGGGSVESTDFPAAPAPAVPRKKPKLKVKPRDAAPAEQGVTRPVPETAPSAPATAPARPAAAQREATPPAQAAVPTPPAPQRPEPTAANSSVYPNQRPAPAPADRSQGSSVSAADIDMSAADMPIVRTSELDGPIQAIQKTVPTPTRAAVEAKLGGRAFLNVLVSGDGSVQEVRLMIDPGLGLGEAARSAVESWRYSRPTREGKPVRVWKTEVVEFEVPVGEDD